MRRTALLLLLCACQADPGDRVGIPRIETGAPAPDYSATSLTGDSVSLAHERGKVVLLNVWATWCHPCRTEIPELQAMHDRYAAQGFEVIGVSVDVDGSDADIRDFMEEYRMTYPVWRDPEERVMARFLVLGVPATYLIDRTGTLLWKKTGPIQPGDTALAHTIERAIGAD
jgi:cytochrome c biogenesis protein CcmG, thiol:disulfide interchange protein DsbE